MRALSILQPWAAVVVDGAKPIENRTWRRDVSGVVLVHAGKRFDADAVQFIQNACRALDITVPTARALAAAPRGAIVGVVRITDCVRPEFVTDSRARVWAFGPWCYRIDRAAAFDEPVPYRGELGFFDVPTDVVMGAIRRLAQRMPTFDAEACDFAA